eukprot:3299593-Rhodomonas_salina.1
MPVMCSQMQRGVADLSAKGTCRHSHLLTNSNSHTSCSARHPGSTLLNRCALQACSASHMSTLT